MSRSARVPSLRGVVYQRVNRTPRDLVEAASICTSADVHDVMGVALGCWGMMSSTIRPLKLGRKAIGPAVTVVAQPGDNLMVHRALSLTEPGDVLVVSAPWSTAAQWGLNAAVWAKSRGVAGVVIEGAVRDAADLIDIDPPTWCTTISAWGPVKRAGGAVNVPLTCAGVTVNPGDLIVADGDGVISVPRELVAEVVEKVRAHAAASAAERARLGDVGPTLYERRDYGKVMAELGIPELDRAWDDD